MQNENGEYTPDLDPGTWVTNADWPEKEVAFVCRMDVNDGEYLVVTFAPEADGTIEGETRWIDHTAELTTTDPPDYINAARHPEHVFVLLWLDETSNEQVATFADPESVLAHLPDALPAEAVANMQLKLMEAVADPGEWFGISESPYATLCFQQVVGAER